MSGRGAPNRKKLKQLMNSDFDSEEWDRQMAAAFDEAYYAEEEAEAAVLADRMEAARELASLGGTPEERSFAGVHTRIIGAAPGELPETDYGLEGAAAADRRTVRQSAAHHSEGEGDEESEGTCSGGSDAVGSEGESRSGASRGGDDEDAVAKREEARSKVRCDSDLSLPVQSGLSFVFHIRGSAQSYRILHSCAVLLLWFCA
jgi:hypothetical protein